MREFQEYPKWLPIGDGIIVWNREDEDKYTQPEEVKPKRGRPKKEVTHGDQ